MSNLADIILKETRQIIENKAEVCPEITVESEFLVDLPMDSLDLATLIVTLELTTGIDPFRDGFKTFHSIAELIALYEGAAV
jgi:acyl carrier protein